MDSARKPKPSAHAKNLAEDQSISFLPVKEWEQAFVEAIRYKSTLTVRNEATNESFNTTLAHYTIDAEKDLLRCESLHFSVYVDRTDPAHVKILEALCANPVSELEAQMHLPSDFLHYKVTVAGIDKAKIHFSLRYPPYRQSGRRFARVAVRIPVVCNVFFSSDSSKKIWIKGEGIDLSEGGLGFILTEKALKDLPPVGEVIEGLFFKLGERVCHLKAVIRHVSLVQQNQFPQKRFRVGVEFTEFDEDAKSFIRAFVIDELAKLTS